MDLVGLVQARSRPTNRRHETKSALVAPDDMHIISPQKFSDRFGLPGSGRARMFVKKVSSMSDLMQIDFLHERYVQHDSGNSLLDHIRVHAGEIHSDIEHAKVCARRCANNPFGFILDEQSPRPVSARAACEIPVLAVRPVRSQV